MDGRGNYWGLPCPQEPAILFVFSLRPSAYLCVLCVEMPLSRRGRRDTQISTHDVSPRDRNRPLVAGVVFNVEPLIETPGKIHMRLEDTVLVTPSGSLNMTAGVPAGLEEIYALVRQKALSVNP